MLLFDLLLRSLTIPSAVVITTWSRSRLKWTSFVVLWKSERLLISSRQRYLRKIRGTCNPQFSASLRKSLRVIEGFSFSLKLRKVS